MNPVTDEAKPDHISFAQPISAHPGTATTTASSTASSTTTSLTGNHVGQAMNGDGNEPPLLHAGSKPKSARPSTLESSQYQLVFGIEDTSSETSLTDSPLHDQSNRILHHFSPPLQDASSESSQADKECDHSVVTNADAGSQGASAERENASGFGVNAGAGNPFTPEDSTVDRADLTPVEGEKLHKDHDTKVIGNGSLPSESQSSPSKDLDGSEQGKSAPLPKSQSQSPDREASESDEIPALRSRSTSSEEVGQQQKAHPLSFLTSDSELGETPTPPPAPTYSPVPNTSGEQGLKKITNYHLACVYRLMASRFKLTPC